ncbi:CobW family GTP-binding protein [Chitinilyticum piscinae]|uniref:GTP-binding protein n=1 Tax=Chitinilyticum piscinae TaxID=2866724 RepID=A0A8J7FEP0_9NEIS|nr:GTP-binding protein [Chitinilyticum piscinae]MBE9608028.1 GTP-binding protein [Chitinilyticum piscinae]
MTAAARVPVNLVTGFLGVGKTTALTHLLADKPADEYWAVVVNEFGEVGIDGATLSSCGEGLQVAEVPGGCICCTTSPLLRVSLTRLLRARRPARLLIEPSGLGHPAGIVDLLRDPMLAKAFELRGVITLLDPAHVGDARYNSHETWRDQLQLADVVVLNKCDRADVAQLQLARELVGKLYPPKLACHETSQGIFPAGLLDIELQPERWGKAPQIPSAHQRSPVQPMRRNKPAAEPAPEAWPLRKAQSSLDSHSCGWIFPAETQFFSAALAGLFERLGQDAALGLAGLSRAKGVFHTERDWYRFDWVDGYPGVQASAYRRDSRCEVIVHAEKAPDWSAFEQVLLDAVINPKTLSGISTGDSD